MIGWLAVKPKANACIQWPCLDRSSNDPGTVPARFSREESYMHRVLNEVYSLRPRLSGHLEFKNFLILSGHVGLVSQLTHAWAVGRRISGFFYSWVAGSAQRVAGSFCSGLWWSFVFFIVLSLFIATHLLRKYAATCYLSLARLRFFICMCTVTCACRKDGWHVYRDGNFVWTVRLLV